MINMKNTTKTRKHEIFKIHDTNTEIFNTQKYKHEIVKSNTRKTENTKFILKKSHSILEI